MMEGESRLPFLEERELPSIDSNVIFDPVYVQDDDNDDLAAFARLARP
jgi:hypothetical protein